MHLRRLRLIDFRSWPLLELDLEPGVTTFVGRNGHGKTNVLEAVTVLATLGSHRVSGDAPLIRSGAETALVGALAHNRGRELTAELAINEGKANRARLNTSPCRRLTDLLGVVQSVLFAPEDLALVRGEPGERRRLLDDLQAQRRPSHSAVLTDYAGVLRQRNALIKSASAALRRGRSAEARASLDTLEVWDGRLAELGARVVADRVSVLGDLRPHVVEAYHRLAPESRPASLTYRFRAGEGGTSGSGGSGSAAPDESDLADPAFVEAALLAELARRRDDELERGLGLVGPHRDDLLLGLGDEPAKGFASHGETWSFALALRLGSLGLLREDGLEPVLLLDDVFAELDRPRRAALAEVAAGVEQVLVTAAVGEDVPDALRGVRHDVVMTGEGADRRSTITGLRGPGGTASQHGDGARDERDDETPEGAGDSETGSEPTPDDTVADAAEPADDTVTDTAGPADDAVTEPADTTPENTVIDCENTAAHEEDER